MINELLSRKQRQPPFLLLLLLVLLVLPSCAVQQPAHRGKPAPIEGPKAPVVESPEASVPIQPSP